MSESVYQDADIAVFSSIFKDRLQELWVLEGLPFRMGKSVSVINLSQIGKEAHFGPGNSKEEALWLERCS
jgi:hypothetical protein